MKYCVVFTGPEQCSCNFPLKYYQIYFFPKTFKANTVLAFKLKLCVLYTAVQLYLQGFYYRTSHCYLKPQIGANICPPPYRERGGCALFTFRRSSGPKQRLRCPSAASARLRLSSAEQIILFYIKL